MSHQVTALLGIVEDTRLVRNNPYATKALTWRMCV
jgi:hypothetical protein